MAHVSAFDDNSKESIAQEGRTAPCYQHIVQIQLAMAASSTSVVVSKETSSVTEMNTRETTKEQDISSGATWIHA